MTQFDIRYSELTDYPFLLKWLSDPDNLKWFPMSTPKEVEMAAKNWVGFSRFRSSLTATIQGEPCGIGTLYLMPFKKLAHEAMFQIIVDKHARKQGIGTSLVKNLVHLAKSYFRLEGIYAEVFGDSPLLSILEKQKFEVFARQADYVKDKDGYLERICLERLF